MRNQYYKCGFCQRRTFNVKRIHNQRTCPTKRLTTILYDFIKKEYINKRYDKMFPPKKLQMWEKQIQELQKGLKELKEGKAWKN